MNKSKGPFLVPIKRYQDKRGVIEVLEQPGIPFDVNRIFWISQVPENTLRGDHAHRSSEQLLICTSGKIEAELEDLMGKQYQYILKPNDQALYIPSKCWGRFRFSNNAQGLCMASDSFDESDYIRDYREFVVMKDAEGN